MAIFGDLVSSQTSCRRRLPPRVGATGKASLAPDGDNRMKGTAAYAATPGMKAVVGIALAGKGTEQARFTPN